MKQITKVALQISVGTVIGTVVYAVFTNHWVSPMVTNMEILAGIWIMYLAAPEYDQ